ncbi:DUF4190 domain-containing protein [Nonomuraea sp. NPDC050536]|uniref:DUF4190 domain-containing protein n=1 Tax=Nonomuraea sp. NPDC050536 TaxID=3364366 RepID=UPI0037C89015
MTTVRNAPSKNTPAKLALGFAGFGVAALGCFFTGIAWMNPPVFVGLAVLSAIAGIVTGHVARSRGKRLSGDGRGMALGAILLSWLVVAVCVLAATALVWLLSGTAIFLDGR